MRVCGERGCRKCRGEGGREQLRTFIFLFQFPFYVCVGGGACAGFAGVGGFRFPFNDNRFLVIG